MADATIIVVTHKPYWMPEDAAYLPVQVGPGEALGFARDNTGADTIAEKNAAYCELTALYWAVRNVEAPALGLAHYRRHFAEPGARGGKQARVLTGDTLRALMQSETLLLPRPRRYYIETNWSQYAHAHHEKDLQALRDVVAARAPAYLDAFDRVMRRTWGHRFNMFVMARPLLDAYAPWLFDLLAAVEPAIDTGGYTPYDKRVFGFLGERLLDVWVEKEGAAYRELPCLYMEDINWPRKALRFIGRKLGMAGARGA